MIICICSNVNEKQVKELLPLPLEEVMIKTGAGMCCGSCMDRLIDVVEIEPNKNPSMLIGNRKRT